MDDRHVDGRTSMERRLDRIEIRVDQLAVEVRAIEVSTVTRLNSIDAKLVFVSQVLDGVNGLSTAILGPSNNPSGGLISRIDNMEKWRDELRGSLGLILKIAAVSPVLLAVVAVWRFATTGTP